MSVITIRAVEVKLHFKEGGENVDWNVDAQATVPDDTKAGGIEEIPVVAVGGTVATATFNNLSGSTIKAQAVTKITPILENLGIGGHTVVDNTA